LMLGHADAISLVPAKSEIEAKVNRMLLGLETWALKRSPHCCSGRVARCHRREIEKLLNFDSVSALSLPEL
jgi:hypothetical protein